MIMTDVERFILLAMLQRVHADKERAEAEARNYAHRLTEVVNASQRALTIAYLARVNRVMVDPKTLIDCLTERDTPHELHATG